MDASLPRLVILRGNSGSGKTTLAKRLQLTLGRGTANIGQDHFRRVVLREHDVRGGDNIEFIASSVRFCLRIGYHVILEGILIADHYGDMLRELIAGHVGASHVFYLDVPLEETLRRHQRRPMSIEVPPDRLREWYIPRDVLGVTGEVVIDGMRDLDTTLAAILSRIGAVQAHPDRDGARFL